MVHAKSTFTILDDVWHSGGEETEEPILCQFGRCIRALTPAVDGASQDFSTDTIVASLIAIAVNRAVDCSYPALIADTLRENAEMLDVEARTGPIEEVA